MKCASELAAAVLVIAVLCHVAASNSAAAVASNPEAGFQAETDQQGLLIERGSAVPPAFTENRGQWDERVKFRADASGVAVWLTTDGVFYQFVRRVERASRFDRQPDSLEELIIKAGFVGANPDAEFVGEGMMEHKCNYLIGNDPSKWLTGVPNYGAVSIRNVYEGIDLRFWGGADGELAYQYSIAPGVDADCIRLEYEGLEEMSVDESGRTVARTEWGNIIGLLAPPSHDSRFDFDGSAPQSAELRRSHPDVTLSAQSKTRAVELIYDAYIVTIQWNEGYAIDIDSSGCAYVTGLTYSLDFPMQNPYDSSLTGEIDAFVTKFSADGSSLIYSTYLGGSGFEEAQGIAVDASGHAHVTGRTFSTDFPMQDAYNASASGDGDAFIATLSAEGNSLVYGTYLGGTAWDYGYAIEVDGSGCRYVSGETESSDFPVEAAYDYVYNGARDAFVTKLSPAGDALVYSTFLGGSGDDSALDIQIYGQGSMYVAGYTGSSDFPTNNAFCEYYSGGGDGFVAKLQCTGDMLVYSTYLGGTSFEWITSLAVDGSGCAYATGYTSSLDFPLENAFDSSFDGGFTDCFVAKLSAAGDSLAYSTYLGGTDWDEGGGIAVGRSGGAYVVGRTYSSNFPMKNAYDDSYNGRGDIFVTKFSRIGDTLVYSTCLGSDESEWGNDIKVDLSGCAYLVGGRQGLEASARGGGGSGYQSWGDVIVAKFGSFPETPCGDADGSGAVDIDDAIYVVLYIFSGGPEPTTFESGDTDCSGFIDIDDVVWLVNFIFSGGNAPCDADGDGVPDC